MINDATKLVGLWIWAVAVTAALLILSWVIKK